MSELNETISDIQGFKRVTTQRSTNGVQASLQMWRGTNLGNATNRYGKLEWSNNCVRKPHNIIKQNKSKKISKMKREIVYITAQDLNVKKYHKTKMTGYKGKERKMKMCLKF